MDNWKIIREADDSMAIRLSVGSPLGYDKTENGYIVYRGDTAECLELLKTAVVKLEQHLEEQGE